MKKFTTVLINASARPNGNTHKALEILVKGLAAESIDGQIINLVEKKLNPCLGCGKCKGTKKCIQNDDVNEVFAKMAEADGIILGSPVYFSNVTSRMAMLIERTGMMSRQNDNLLQGKIGASVAVNRRSGANIAYSIMNFFFGINNMPIATSTYWNNVQAGGVGEIDKDKEGLEVLQNLAKSIAKMIKALRS